MKKAEALVTNTRETATNEEKNAAKSMSASGATKTRAQRPSKKKKKVSRDVSTHELGEQKKPPGNIMAVAKQYALLSAPFGNKSRKSVATSFKHPLDYIFNNGHNYHLQGDPNMYSKENLNRRQQLRKSLKLREVIKKFCELYNRESNGDVSKTEYTRLYKIIGQILRPKTPMDKFDSMAEQEWVRDVGDAETISDSKLQEITFDFVDIWLHYLLEYTCTQNSKTWGPQPEGLRLLVRMNVFSSGV